MLAPVTHILPLTLIRRTRLLPTPGRVLVNAGQKVAATDVIADARMNTQHMVLDIGRGLGMPADQVDQYVTRKVGEEVNETDVIAGPVGVFPRTVRAPRSGRIVAIGGGQVLLELGSAPFELIAGLSGTVTDLIPERGAVIETVGALVQGVWGNGKIDKGILTVVCHTPDEELSTSQLDVSMRGVVVLGGPCTSEEVLRTAADIPLRGLIIPSLSANLVSVAAELALPILLLEGFGKIPIDRSAYQVLSTNDKREVVVNAVPRDRRGGRRPEVIIPLPSSGQIPRPREADIFAPGQTVRMLRTPYAASTGTLVTIRPGKNAFQSGIHAPAAVVRLENGDQVMVPLANLEVIE